MRTHGKVLYWPDPHFPSLYEEPWGLEGVRMTIARMKERINTSVVEFELVHEDFVRPYLKLVDALEKLSEALLELCPEGILRFELTREHGIKMLFKTRRHLDGKIYTMIEIGWIYANGVASAVEERLNAAGATIQEVSHAA